MDFNAWLADMTGFLSRYSALFIGGLRNTLILSAIAGVLSILVGGGLCFPSHEQDRTASLDRKYMDRIRARYAGSGTDHARVLRPADDRH